MIDPGGPGVSGVDNMANELGSLTRAATTEHRSVDPRGVDRGDPVALRARRRVPAGLPPDPVQTTSGAEATTIAGYRQYAAGCEKASGTVLAHCWGWSTPHHDMERLRIALGDSGLSYMGQSYGSLLGLTYASLFPTHVTPMVLNSVIDPALSFNQITQGQANGFEASLQSFFSWCAGTNACPWRTGADPTSSLLALIASSAAAPVEAGNSRTAGAGELFDALFGRLYPRADWPELGAALAANLPGGNGAQIVSMSDIYNKNGSSNGGDAALAIDCLDHPVSHDLRVLGSPGPTKCLVTRRVGNQVRHDSLLDISLAMRWFVFQKGFQIGAQISRIAFRRFFLGFVDVDEHFEAKRVLIRPMLVNCRFTYSGGRGDGVNAGSVDSVFSKKFRCAFENFEMSPLA